MSWLQKSISGPLRPLSPLLKRYNTYKPRFSLIRAQPPGHFAVYRALAIAAKCCSGKGAPSPKRADFWMSAPTWKRSGINTLRCLAGCTTGDFSAMWYLQSAYPDLDTVVCMSLSMAAGILTSVFLETTLLHLGRDRLPWEIAAKTATGMSMISMLAMEMAENTVNYTLTGGHVDLASTYFWIAATISAFAGFVVPLPYNYHRLRAYRQSCH